jgi:hypothetical protein
LCRSLRTRSASTRSVSTLASPGSDLAPDVTWRSRYRLAASGLIA